MTTTTTTTFTHVPTARRALLLGAGLLFSALPATAGRDPEAVELLRAARAAALEVETASYRFENGHATAPFGWVTGSVLSRRGAGGEPWIRVDGTFHPQPGFGRQGFDFTYLRDESRARQLRGGELESAAVGADPAAVNRLEGNASYGFLPELFEAAPYWKELELATAVELAGRRTVGGVECDVVRTELASAAGPVYQDWYLARGDRLPRGLLWWMEAGGQRAEMPFEIHDLRVNQQVKDADRRFRLAEPAVEPSGPSSAEAPSAALGAPAPDFTLEDAAGQPVKLSELRGKVVVLDFWNTGCYLCHNALPQVAALAAELAAAEVEFLALDVWERGDPVAYWRERGFSPRLLLDADPVAAAYGISGQPAVVVVGRDGRVAHAQVGFTADRAARLRAAVARALGP